MNCRQINSFVISLVIISFAALVTSAAPPNIPLESITQILDKLECADRISFCRATPRYLIYPQVYSRLLLCTEGINALSVAIKRSLPEGELRVISQQLPERWVPSLIRRSVQRRDAKTIRLLLDSDPENYELLEYSVRMAHRHGYKELVDWLVDFDARLALDNRSTNIEQPHEHDEVGNMEVGEDAKKDNLSGQQLDIQLILACRSGQGDISSLLDRGANANANSGEPLMWTATYGNLPMTKTLLLYGADQQLVTARDALWKACEAGHTHIVALLIDFGANLSGENGQLAMKKAMWNGKGQVSRLLISRGVSIRPLLNDKQLIIEASMKGYLEVLRILLEHYKLLGVPLDKNTLNQGLRLACQHAHHDVIIALLDNGADIRLDNDLVLRQAALNGFYSLIKRCIEAGANVHANGEQAILNAASMGKLFCMELLVENQADYRWNNDEPLRLATANGHTGAMIWLITQSAMQTDDDEVLR